MNQRRTITMSIVLISIFSAHSGWSLSRAQDKPDEPIILVDGTALTVVTMEEIDSKTVNPGDVLVFRVDSDVTVGGHVVISKDTRAKGSVINAEAGGSMGK